MDLVNLNWFQLIFIFSLLLIPMGLFSYFRIMSLKKIIFPVLRMSLQLSLVGIYLNLIFDLNLFWLNLLWMLAMLIVANLTLLNQTGLKKTLFFIPVFFGLAISSLSVAFLFVGGIINPAPFYDARYIIPIFGMILGNCMRGNVLSLESFYSGIRQREKEFITRQMLGATLTEAGQPFFNQAILMAIKPQLATMATMGIVSLPGMMTGQILGGSLPVTAIKYQVAIMICIFTTMAIGSILNILLSRSIAFTPNGRLKQGIFR